jgi:translocation and assembly module TamB
VYRVPVHITDGRGKVAMRDSIVSMDFSDVRLPASHGSLLGRVIMEKGRNVFDIQTDLDNFAFSDMTWLYDKLPAQGGGRGRMRIQTLRNGTLFLAENARLTTPGTNVAGDFGIVVGDTVYFTKVNLRASPLNVDILKRMLPNGLPIDGLLMGTVELKGPLSALQTKGDVTIASHGSTSKVKWNGTVDTRNRTIGSRGIQAEVQDFDLALLRAMQPKFTLAGHITGNVGATRDTSGGIRIAADVQHRSEKGTLSNFTGGGLLLGAAGARAIDMDWDAKSLSLSALAEQYPALRGLNGVISGPVHIAGPLDDLTYRAVLATAGGTVDLDGWLRRNGAQPRYGGEGRTTSFAMQKFDQRLPIGNVSGRFAFDLAGTALDNTAGTVRIDLDSARIGHVPLQHSIATARMDAGMLYVDTIAATTIAGDVLGHGSFGLTANKSGKLDFSMLSQSLAGLEADLFGTTTAPATDAPRLAGSVRGDASIEGSIYGAAFTGNATLGDAVFGPLRARAASLNVNGRLFDSTGATIRAVAHADTLKAYLHTFHIADLSISSNRDSANIYLTGGDKGVNQFLLNGRLDTDSAGKTFRLAELTLGNEQPWSLEKPATLQWHDGQLNVQEVALHNEDGSATADAVGTLAWNDSISPMQFHLGLHSVPVEEFLRATNSDLPGAGNIEGTIEVSGTAISPRIDGDLAVTSLRYGDLHLDRLSAKLNYADDDLSSTFEATHGSRRVLYGGGNSPLDLRFTSVDERRLELPLSLSFTADSLPLALALGAMPGFTEINGRIDGIVTAHGTTLVPSLGGSLEVRDGGATWDATGVHYYGVNGTAKLGEENVVDVLATGRTASQRKTSKLVALAQGNSSVDGTADVSGRLDFTELTNPGFDLKLNASQLLAARRREADITMTGSMQLGGHYQRPAVTGEVTIDRGDLYLDEVYKRYLVVELDPSLLFNVIDTSVVAVRRVLPVSDNPFLKNLLVDNAIVHVTPGNAWLRSRDLDVLVSGDLTVALDRRDEDLRMSGTLGVIRGTYNLSYPPLQSRRFQVREGTIEFPGTPGIDPNLSITAAYRAPTRNGSEPLDILAIVTGTLQTPRVRLSSDAEPPISESDLASYLFFGVPSWQVATLSGGPTQNFGTSLGLATLAPSMLGYAASGLQTLSQRFGLDYVGISAAEAAPGQIALNNAFLNFFASTQIEVGTYISPDVYLGFTKRLSGAAGARTEWRYSPLYTAQLFTEDRFANTPSFGLQQATSRRVTGFFLFREWGY